MYKIIGVVSALALHGLSPPTGIIGATWTLHLQMPVINTGESWLCHRRRNAVASRLLLYFTARIDREKELMAPVHAAANVNTRPIVYQTVKVVEPT